MSRNCKHLAKIILGMIMAVSLASGIGSVASLTALAQEAGETSLYTVKDGDCLYNIARKELGDGSRYGEIFELNRDQIKDPSRIHIGQTLTMPLRGDMAESLPTETSSSSENEAAQDAEDASEQAQADRIAGKIYETAQKAEPAITARLEALEDEKARLTGLENRLKTIESLSRKILSDAHDMEVRLEEAAAEISDSVRYTYLIDESDYVSETKHILDELTNSGFTLVKFSNYWADDGRAYQGINTVLKNADGIRFEVQFHTPTSYDVKSEKTHKYYEIIRDENSTEEEKEEARKIQDALFAEIPVPEGVREFTYPTGK